jgi:hypothetical protein
MPKLRSGFGPALCTIQPDFLRLTTIEDEIDTLA